MLDLNAVNRLVGKAAAEVLNGAAARTFADYTTDSDGHDAFLVTIVLRDQDENKITGRMASQVILRIHHALLDVGEEHFPIISFATEAELAQNDDPEE
jgi:hypothetical protein